MEKIFTDALFDIKKNPKILGCSAIYCTFIMLLAFLRYTAHDSVFSLNVSSLTSKVLYQFASFIIYIFEILLFLAYVYMIINKKFKFKRFFTFFHKKNLRYDIALIAVVALPITVIKCLFQFAASIEYIYVGFIAAVLFLIIDLFKDIIICQKAKYSNESFKEIISDSAFFLRHNIVSVIVFELCFVPIYAIIGGLSMKVIDQIAYPDLAVMIDSVHCGFDVFYLPFYIMSLAILISKRMDIELK